MAGLPSLPRGRQGVSGIIAVVPVADAVQDVAPGKLHTDRFQDASRARELAQLEMDAPVQLLALAAGVVADGALPTQRDDLDGRLRHPELDQELLDGLGALLR